MYKCLFIYNYYVYKRYVSMYVSMYAVGYMCSDCGINMYVDTSKL